MFMNSLSFPNRFKIFIAIVFVFIVNNYRGCSWSRTSRMLFNIRFSARIYLYPSIDEHPTSSYGVVKTLICTSVYLKHQDFIIGIQTFVCFHLFESNCKFSHIAHYVEKYSICISTVNTNVPSILSLCNANSMWKGYVVKTHSWLACTKMGCSPLWAFSCMSMHILHLFGIMNIEI